jgi:hypothetical protein
VIKLPIITLNFTRGGCASSRCPGNPIKNELSFRSIRFFFACLHRKFCTAASRQIKNPLPFAIRVTMPQKPSSFDGQSYAGYRVSVRLAREGLEEHEPVNVSGPADVYRFVNDLKHRDY